MTLFAGSVLDIENYKIIGRGERIRTSDLSVPNRAHYQAVLRPEEVRHSKSRVEDGQVWCNFNSLTYSRNGGADTGLAESHAAAIKHNVIRIEKTIGMIKR